MTPGVFVLLLAAGIGGGLAGSVAGLASLVTYPALLAVGLPPLTANVTNTVSLVFSSVGSVLGSRSELAGQGPRLRTLAPVAVLGGAAGAALLLSTPVGGFEKVVPWLLGFASLTILLPRRRRATPDADAGRPSRKEATIQGLAIFLIAVYGGYFGAAAGVLLLAFFLWSTAAPLPVANATKNVVLGLANGVAALSFAFLAPVNWAAAVPVGLGCLIGARCGPAVVRWAPVMLIRVVIGLAGMALAVRLGIGAY